MKSTYRKSIRWIAIFLATVPSAIAGTMPKSVSNPPSSADCPWLNSALSTSQRLQMLLPKLTLTEKIALVHGYIPRHHYGGYVAAIPSLCIPALKFQDGPAGVADGMAGITALPAPVAGASTWNTKLMYQYGKVIGEEARTKGVNVLLGPMVNILRDPRWGRAWETYSEDPYLNGAIGVSVINGVQSQNVIAMVKHMAAYDQDQTGRGNSIVGVRALHEIYLPAFHQAIFNGHAGAVMMTGGAINNLFANENTYLMKDTVENRWGFQGLISSDYDGARSAIGSANAGLDLDMPKARNFAAPLLQAVQSGKVPMSRLNDMVASILRQEFRFGIFNHPDTGYWQTPATSRAHTAIATRVAEEGTVLLKNAGDQLPLNPNTVGSIAVIGAAGSAYPKAVGCGSGQARPPYIITPLQGLRSLLGPNVHVEYAQGSNPPLVAHPAPTAPLIAKAVAIARKSGVAIVFADDVECEGGGIAYGPGAPPKWVADYRPNISLSGDQNQLISAVAAVNPHTIVVLNTGAPVDAPWLDKVNALMEAWYPGQVDGKAIASLLFGKANPSGHTVQTWPVDDKQMPTVNPALWGPGILWPNQSRAQLFSDNLDVGYRYYDAHHIKPLFPFGYGLSYTSFAFSHLQLQPEDNMPSGTVDAASANSRQQAKMIEVSATITNTGKVAGADALQLYVGDPAVANEPPRQLKGFSKVFLQPGKSATVHFVLNGHDLSYWKNKVNGWVLPSGTFQVFVGDSSALANLPLHAAFTVTSSGAVQLKQ